MARLDLAIHEDDATTSCKPDESSRKRQSGCRRGVMELRCAELEAKINRKRQKRAPSSSRSPPATVPGSTTYGCGLPHPRLQVQERYRRGAWSSLQRALKEDKVQFMAIVKKVAMLVEASDPKVLVLKKSTLESYRLQY